jgi:hypothetical protein
MWTRVWIDPDSNAIWVHQGSWDGENILGLFGSRERATPVIVFLPKPPTHVYATDLLSGDGILSGPPAQP